MKTILAAIILSVASCASDPPATTASAPKPKYRYRNGDLIRVMKDGLDYEPAR